MNSIFVLAFLAFSSLSPATDWKVVATYPVFDQTITEISVQPEIRVAFLSTGASSVFIDLRDGRTRKELEVPGRGYFTSDGLYFVGVFEVQAESGCGYQTRIYRLDDLRLLIELPNTKADQALPLLTDRQIVTSTVEGRVQVFDVDLENQSLSKASVFEVPNLQSPGNSGIKQLFLSKEQQLVGLAYIDENRILDQDSTSARIFRMSGQEVGSSRRQNQLMNDDWIYLKSPAQFFATAVDDLDNKVSDLLDENGNFLKFGKSIVLPDHDLAVTGHRDGRIRVWSCHEENEQSNRQDELIEYIEVEFSSLALEFQQDFESAAKKWNQKPLTISGYMQPAITSTPQSTFSLVPFLPTNFSGYDKLEVVRVRLKKGSSLPYETKKLIVSGVLHVGTATDHKSLSLERAFVGAPAWGGGDDH